jgi:putative transposase
MERIARVVADGIPHHITQRGNRRQKTLLSDEDYAAYIYCMAPWCREYAVDIRIYCLMPNHGHLISVPSKKTYHCLAIDEAHRRYTLRINVLEGWRGHWWKEQSSSLVMDAQYLPACIQYSKNNPVHSKPALSLSNGSGAALRPIYQVKMINW